MRLDLGALDLTNGQRYPLDGSEIPFPSVASVRALLPGYAQGDDAGAMRDIVLTVIQRLANKVWADTGIEFNAFVSPRYAFGRLLDDVWGVLLQRPRANGEADPPYRLRLLSGFSAITPNAIKAAVRAVAAPFNANVAFQEPAVDQMWWGPDDTSSTWVSFWQPDNGIYWNYDPSSPNPTSGGYWAPNLANPPTLNSDGALFWVIMQLGAGSEALAPHWLADSDLGDDPQDFWGNGTDGTQGDGFWAFDGDPLELKIISEVESRRAFGLRWLLIEDPNLVNAI